MEPLYPVILAVIWPFLTAIVAWLILRLTRAIDRLSDSAGAHDVRLMRIETKMGIET